MRGFLNGRDGRDVEKLGDIKIDKPTWCDWNLARLINIVDAYCHVIELLLE